MGKCAIAGRECPRTNDQSAKGGFCPAWSDGLVWTNTQTGAEKIMHCSFEALMPAVVEVIKASNRPAAAIESARNEIVKSMHGLAQSVSSLPAPSRMKAIDG